jgi:hypothetical protein
MCSLMVMYRIVVQAKLKELSDLGGGRDRPSRQATTAKLSVSWPAIENRLRGGQGNDGASQKRSVAELTTQGMAGIVGLVSKVRRRL